MEQGGSSNGIWRIARRFAPLGLVLLLALALRVHKIGQDGLWLDELFSMELSRGHGYAHEFPPERVLLHPPKDWTSLAGAAPWWRIWPEQGRDSNPPLYFITLRLWRELFGEADVAARTLSVVASLAGIALLYDMVRLMSGRGAALWAALLMAVAGSMVEYAQEARGYALMVLLVIGTGNALVRIERLGPSVRRLVALGACAFGAMATHYFAVGALAGMGAYALLRLRGPARTRTLVSFTLAGIVYAALMGPVLWRQMQLEGALLGWLEEDPADHEARTIAAALEVPIRLLGTPVEPSQALRVTGLVLLVMPLLLLRRERGLLSLAYLWMLGPIVLLTIMDLAQTRSHLQFPRYAIAAAPGLFALLPALLWNRVAAWQRHAVPAIAVAYCALSIGAVYTPWPEDWRVAARHLDEVAPRGTWVFMGLEGGLLYMGVHRYAEPHHTAIVVQGKGPPADLPGIDEAIVLRRPNEEVADYFPGWQLGAERVIPYIGVAQRITRPAPAATTQATPP